MDTHNTTIKVVYVSQAVSYDSSWILGVFASREGAVGACIKFIDKQIEDYTTWGKHDDFASDNIEYYTSIRDKDFSNYKRNGSRDSPIIEVYELDRYVE